MLTQNSNYSRRNTSEICLEFEQIDRFWFLAEVTYFLVICQILTRFCYIIPRGSKEHTFLLISSFFEEES